MDGSWITDNGLIGLFWSTERKDIPELKKRITTADITAAMGKKTLFGYHERLKKGHESERVRLKFISPKWCD